MNKMEEVAKLLGLELNEVFKIKGYQAMYEMTIEGLKADSYYIHDKVLTQLLIDPSLIIKMPKKPVKGQAYWVPVISDNSKKAVSYNWFGDIHDNYFWESGIIRMSEGESLELREKIIEVCKK